MDRGVLISFEGIDGCGKSTQLHRLATRLRLAGHEPLELREPGGTRLGEHVRELLLDPQTGEIAPAAEALLYAASRAELVAGTIEPALAEGRIVLMDRYVDSSLAYQGAGRGLGIERVLEANLLATGGRLPDITLYLDVTPADARARRAAADEHPDRLELAGSAFFDRVHEAYAQIASKSAGRVRRVDGSGTQDAVTAAIDDVLVPFLAAHGVSYAPHTSEPAV